MRFAILLASLLVPGIASAASFHRFDLPGAGTTCGTAIASTGLVAGFGTGGSLPGPTPFLLRGKHFKAPAFTLPAGEILIEGVNRAGGVVGFDLFSASIGTVSFEGRGGTVIEAPQFNDLSAITDSGTVLGQISASKQPLQIYNVGVIQTKAGQQTILDDGTGDTNPAALDDSAQHAVGTSFSGNGVVAWRWDAGSFTTIAVPGASATFPAAVTTAGIVYGSYATGPASGAVSHGFILGPQGYRSWDVPHATSTEINDANAAGQVTGCYTDKQGATHGYIAVP
jgi:hypothetical protein